MARREIEDRNERPQSAIMRLLRTIKGSSPSTELSPALASRCASSPAPWGVAAIAPELIGQQAYDVVAELHMPRTPSNLEAGNFMIDARLLSSPVANKDKDALPNFINNYDPTTSLSDPPTQSTETMLAHARRPAILPYRSPLLTLYETILSLPRATFGLATESSTVRIPLFTRVSFPRGRQRVPTAVHVQLQTPSGIQLRVYSAEIHFRARFTGLRYAMYNFRIASACVFVSAFFVAESITALAVYAILSFVVFGGSSSSPSAGEGRVKNETDTEGSARIKAETDAEETDRYMSDTERSFPTYGSQPPLRYTGRPKIKSETPDDDAQFVQAGPSVSQMTPGPGAEADDEDDEDADFVLDDAGRWRDSGLGTSMESGRERSGVRRRRSRGGSGGGGALR
ncbi:hypothetical protein ANO11243_059970 [Dothideomycetidae sp. 11243]|nr:hypothetical protein ANO11243_059970 [fungal sp. No.11243]